jgi:hypothetical protein
MVISPDPTSGVIVIKRPFKGDFSLMATEKTEDQSAVQPAPAKSGISLDWWSVIVGLILVALILIGIIPSVTW